MFQPIEVGRVAEQRVGEHLTSRKQRDQRMQQLGGVGQKGVQVVLVMDFFREPLEIQKGQACVV